MDATLPLRLPDRNTVSIIARIGNGLDHLGMDVSNTRARNIAMLVEQAGGPTAFGKLIDRDQVQVSQWTSEAKPKPIGGRLARYIEGKLGHEHGWLDAPRWDAGEPAPESHSLHMRLDPEMMAELGTVLAERWHNAGQTFDIRNEACAAQFAEGYELFVRMKERPVPENLVAFSMVLARSPRGMGRDERSEDVPAQGTLERSVGRGHGTKA